MNDIKRVERYVITNRTSKRCGAELSIGFRRIKTPESWLRKKYSAAVASAAMLYSIASWN